MPNLDLSILVVDDTKFSSTIIAKTLKKSGYRDVRIANDAQTALKVLDQRKASVLIADWLMPEMDGLDFLIALRTQSRSGRKQWPEAECSGKRDRR